MLGSVSSVQPVVQGSFAPQHSIDHKKSAESQNKANDSLQTESSKQTKKAVQELSKEELAKVQQLKRRDIEVKSHERAHLSAAGSMAASGASFSYTTGPNGVRYATGGEVSIDTSKIEGDPAATLRKADAIRRAALAPISPSSQDQIVANKATSMAEIARTELIQLRQEEKANPIESKKTKEQEKDDTKIETDNNATIDSITGTLLNLTV